MTWWCGPLTQIFARLCIYRSCRPELLIVGQANVVLVLNRIVIFFLTLSPRYGGGVDVVVQVEVVLVEDEVVVVLQVEAVDEVEEEDEVLVVVVVDAVDEVVVRVDEVVEEDDDVLVVTAVISST